MRRPLPIRIVLGVIILLAAAAVSAVMGRLLLGESLADGVISFVLFAVLVWPVLWWFDRRQRNER